MNFIREKEFREVLVDVVNNPKHRRKYLPELQQIKSKLTTSRVVKNCCVQLIYIIENHKYATQQDIIDLVAIPPLTDIEEVLDRLDNLGGSLYMRKDDVV